MLTVYESMRKEYRRKWREQILEMCSSTQDITSYPPFSVMQLLTDICLQTRIISMTTITCKLYFVDERSVSQTGK